MTKVVLEFGEYFLVVNKKEADEITKMEKFIPVVEVDPAKPEYLGTILGFFVWLDEEVKK